MLANIRSNSFIQLLLMAFVVTAYNIWIYITPLGALFGGYAFEWYALVGDPISGIVRYFWPLAGPLLCLFQGIEMLNAVKMETWVKKVSGISPLSFRLLKVLYIYCALACIMTFLLAQKFYWSLF